MEDKNPDYSQKMEIELLKKDVNSITKLLEKFDVTIDKMQQVAHDISRIVSLQEQRLQLQEKINEEVERVLDKQQKEHTLDVKELNGKIEDVHERIDKTENIILDELKSVKEDLSKKIGVIEAWRYTVMGAIALATWFVAQALDLAKLF